jgi:hypothetical protein
LTSNLRSSIFREVSSPHRSPRLLALLGSASVILLCSSAIVPASVAASSAGQPADDEPSGDDSADGESADDDSADLFGEDDAATETPTSGDLPEGFVRVHVVNERPDPDRGFLKLAKYRATTASAAANAIVVTTHYDEICTEPCSVEIDTSERPLFFFIRDDQPASYAFRLNQPGEYTLSVKPLRARLKAWGQILTGMLILPAGIPMWIAGNSKVSIAAGPPAAGQAFTKLKKAKR